MVEWSPRVADTSWLYALYDETDAHHGEAVGELARPAPIVLAGEVVVEALGLWRHRLGRQAARTCFADIRSRPNVEMVHETDAHDAAKLVGEVRGSFVDAVVLWHCRRLGIPPLTYDQRLANLAAPAERSAQQR